MSYLPCLFSLRALSSVCCSMSTASFRSPPSAIPTASMEFSSFDRRIPLQLGPLRYGFQKFFVVVNHQNIYIFGYHLSPSFLPIHRIGVYKNWFARPFDDPPPSKIPEAAKARTTISRKPIANDLFPRWFQCLFIRHAHCINPLCIFFSNLFFCQSKIPSPKPLSMACNPAKNNTQTTMIRIIQGYQQMKQAAFFSV